MKLPLQKSRLNKKLLNLNLGTCLVMIEIARSAAVITDVACESNKGSSRINDVVSHLRPKFPPALRRALCPRAVNSRIADFALAAKVRSAGSRRSMWNMSPRSG